MLPLLLAGGCLEEPPFRCQSDEVCLLQGFMGTCNPATATCVYPSADCRGVMSIDGYVDGKGNCVPAPSSSIGPGPTTTTTAAGSESAETTDDPSTTGRPGTTDETTTTDPTTHDESSTGELAESSTGPSTTSGGSCSKAIELTAQGTVTATTVFNGFPATDAVDGAANTSWFSTGPEGDGGPSVFGWSTVTDRCINRIEVDDNSAHSNPDFHTGYGFGSAVVRVVQGDTVVFEETVQLPGTPDGPFAVDTGGVIGSRVLLELNAHENAECGGFSELRVYGSGA